MKTIRLFTLILVTSLISCSYAKNLNIAKDDMIILKIIVPLDNKQDTETGHVAIEYYLRKSGFAYDMRNIYGLAQQASRQKQLNEEEVKEIIDLVKKLPRIEYGGEKDKSLILEVYNEKEEMIRYKQDDLPKDLKRVFELLGGIRFEIEDRLRFERTAIAVAELGC